MTKIEARLDGHVGTAFILPMSSGVEYLQQAGGTMCLQMRLEGILVPFGNDCLEGSDVLQSIEKELHAYFCGHPHRGTGAVDGLSVGDADSIDAPMQRR